MHIPPLIIIYRGVIKSIAFTDGDIIHIILPWHPCGCPGIRTVFLGDQIVLIYHTFFQPKAAFSQNFEILRHISEQISQRFPRTILQHPILNTVLHFTEM